MGKLEKYSSYKESGVEWLGEIPEHWKIIKMKYITKFISGFPFNSQKFDEYDGVNVVRIGDIKDTIDLSKCMKSLENKIHKNTIIVKNDTLVALSGATTGKSCFVYEDIKETYINQRIAKFNYKNSFLYYCISNEKFKKDILLSADGSAQENVSNTTIGNMFIPFPKDDEQTKIASFLDEKTSQIDNAISQKEKLIELLKERRQITINEAVTKGLDIDVEFKDSGVEWIGEIPKHWKINRLKFLFKIRKRIANSLGYDVLSITQKGIKVKDIDSGEGQLAMDYSKYQLAFKGDFAMNHMDLLTGYIDISNFNGVISPDYRVFTLEDGNCIPEYYLRLFQMCYYEKIFYAFGQGVSQLGRWRFPADNFNNFFVPIPPKEEQLQIVEYIETQTAKIDKAIELQQNYIAKLKEYKASLIDSVVTGKVRVA